MALRLAVVCGSLWSAARCGLSRQLHGCATVTERAQSPEQQGRGGSGRADASERAPQMSMEMMKNMSPEDMQVPYPPIPPTTSRYACCPISLCGRT
eukprot:3147097-Rhodomonas_salina.1